MDELRVVLLRAVAVVLAVFTPLLQCLGEVRVVVVRLEPRQQGVDRRGDVADQPEMDRRPPAEVRRVDIDLDDPRLVGVELGLGEIGAEAEQEVGAFDGFQPGAVAEDAGHADVERVVRLDEFLGAAGVDHRRFQRPRQRHHLVVGVARAHSGIERDSRRAVEHVRQFVEFGVGGAHDRGRAVHRPGCRRRHVR